MKIKAKFDIGIFGLWYGNNYGSIITYYALNSILQALNFSTVMICNPLEASKIKANDVDSQYQIKFAYDHYAIAPYYSLEDMWRLNVLCDIFLVGSDQLWNYHLSKPYKQSYFLDFIAEEKKKLSIATSFGFYPYNGTIEEKQRIAFNLSRFNGVSVRDSLSKRILDEMNIQSTQILDPVFLCDSKKYQQLIKEEDYNITKDHILAYILDPTPEIGKVLSAISASTSTKIHVIFDKNCDIDVAKSCFSLSNKNIVIIERPTIPEWLSNFQNSQFVITDSFHGTCFSIVFEKNFISLKNNRRGGERFLDLLEPLSLLDHLTETPNNIYNTMINMQKEGIDYTSINDKLNAMKTSSLEWIAKKLKAS